MTGQQAESGHGGSDGGRDGADHARERDVAYGEDPSQILAAAAIAAPPSIVNTAGPASRQGTALIISVSSAPAMMLVTTGGSGIAPNAARARTPS